MKEARSCATAGAIVAIVTSEPVVGMFQSLPLKVQATRAKMRSECNLAFCSLSNIYERKTKERVEHLIKKFIDHRFRSGIIIS